MSRRQRSLRKLGNARRALSPQSVSSSGVVYTQPQKMAQARVDRWTERCTARGYL